MPDDADNATAIIERERESALAAHHAEEAHRARIAESMKPYDPSLPVDCLDCGARVPPERTERYPHTRRCTACASDIEGKRKWKA